MTQGSSGVTLERGKTCGDGCLIKVFGGGDKNWVSGITLKPWPPLPLMLAECCVGVVTAYTRRGDWVSGTTVLTWPPISAKSLEISVGVAGTIVP